MMQARPSAPITPGREPYDAIVVGSGAAGGMAAFQLAMSGIKVLLLEAGRMLDPQKEYKTMEWPYKGLRRHRLPVGEFALSAAEYRTLDRPYGLTPEMQKYKKVMAYSGNHFTRAWIADEKENPITGTPNEKKMVADMADSIEEMLRAAGAEDIEVGKEPLPEGWSIHEVGTARMGTDPASSYSDSWCRPHGIANVFLADASPYVTGGTQNTTWTILAMCWRTMDFVKEQMRSGNL